MTLPKEAIRLGPSPSVFPSSEFQALYGNLVKCCQPALAAKMKLQQDMGGGRGRAQRHGSDWSRQGFLLSTSAGGSCLNASTVQVLERSCLSLVIMSLGFVFSVCLVCKHTHICVL